MKIYLSRWVCLDSASNLSRFRTEVERAVGAGASIVVFPELFLTGYSRSVDLVAVRELFARISADAPEVLFVFGSISEDLRGSSIFGSRAIAMSLSNGETSPSG